MSVSDGLPEKPNMFGKTTFVDLLWMGQHALFQRLEALFVHHCLLDGHRFLHRPRRGGRETNNRQRNPQCKVSDPHRVMDVILKREMVSQNI